jgi:hypothetical protein
VFIDKEENVCRQPPPITHIYFKMMMMLPTNGASVLTPSTANDSQPVNFTSDDLNQQTTMDNYTKMENLSQNGELGSLSPSLQQGESSPTRPENSAEYLGHLIKDKKQLQAFPGVFTHVERLLDDG